MNVAYIVSWIAEIICG